MLVEQSFINTNNNVLDYNIIKSRFIYIHRELFIYCYLQAIIGVYKTFYLQIKYKLDKTEVNTFVKTIR